MTGNRLREAAAEMTTVIAGVGPDAEELAVAALLEAIADDVERDRHAGMNPLWYGSLKAAHALADAVLGRDNNVMTQHS